jgi:hypothetical protein
MGKEKRAPEMESVTTAGGNTINSNDILAAIQYPDPRRKAEEEKQLVSSAFTMLGRKPRRHDCKLVIARAAQGCNDFC